jgi:membrane protein
MALPRPDLVLGAFVTAVLFTVGKSLIGIYLGRAAHSSPDGAAGALIVLMFSTYYCAQIFLLRRLQKPSLTSARRPPKPTEERFTKAWVRSQEEPIGR